MATNQEECRQQLAQLISSAQANGHKLYEIIPQEVQDHFQQTTPELTTLQDQIKKLELHSQDLEAKNTALQSALKEKEDELENEPTDISILKGDLKQAEHQTRYYKELAEDAQRRAERYQNTLVAATKAHIVASEIEAKKEQLQHDLNRHQLTIRRLQEENARAAEIFHSIRAEDARALAVAENKLLELQMHAEVVERESEAFNAAYTGLIDTLETENTAAASVLNNRAAVLQKMELLYNVVASEIAPLNRFYSRAFQMLQIYQVLFQTLSDPRATGLGKLPRDLDALIEGASQDVYAYREMHAMFASSSEKGGLAEEHVRDELNGMSKSAEQMLMSLKLIKRDVEGFLARLGKEPGSWLAMKARFGGR